MMRILGIDTTGPVASCAAMEDGRILHLVQLNHGLTHSEALMPAVDEVLEGCGWRAGDVDCFAAAAGPGSFTGVRIGICAAKGLAHAVHRPCARVDALEALAWNFWGFAGVICPILDARRHQVYTAQFDAGCGKPARIAGDRALPLTELLDELDKCGHRVMFLGDGLDMGWPEIPEKLGERAMRAPAGLRDLTAAAVCSIAAADPSAWMEPAGLTPIYLRAPQAERERERRRREADA